MRVVYSPPHPSNLRQRLVALPPDLWRNIDQIAQASRDAGDDDGANHSSVVYNLIMTSFALQDLAEQSAEELDEPSNELNMAHSGGTVESRFRIASSGGRDPHDYIDAEMSKKKEEESED